MNNELSLYHNMLFLDLRPWKKRDVSEPKFKELLLGISKEDFSFQPLYEVVFEKPLTAKRKYYHALIENEAARYLNDFHSIIAGAEKVVEKKYWVHTTLTKVISQKLKETSKAIEDYQYYFEQLLTGTKSKSIGAYIFDETYIIQFLKYQLIRIYLEIQQAFQNYLKEDTVTEGELHSIYFTEQCPVKSFIVEAQKIKLAATASQDKAKPASLQFKAKAFDFRGLQKNTLSYETIINDKNRFSRFEEELFSNSFIDHEYNYIDKHSRIQEIAAIFHTLIKKGYFNKRQFPKNKEIKPVEIRKFLDFRYNSNTDKQFRTWSNKPTELADFVEARYWIDNLPTC